MKTIKVGRKTIKYESENFEYFQPNTHSCGDCSIRAVVKATNSNWYTVFDGLTEIARKMQTLPNDRKVVDKYLKDKGFTWVPVNPRSGEKRPTVKQFAKEHKETCVLSVASHLTSCRGGKFYDTWDCGNRSLYGYWIKKD